MLIAYASIGKSVSALPLFFHLHSFLTFRQALDELHLADSIIDTDDEEIFFSDTWSRQRNIPAKTFSIIPARLRSISTSRHCHTWCQQKPLCVLPPYTLPLLRCLA